MENNNIKNIDNVNREMPKLSDEQCQNILRENQQLKIAFADQGMAYRKAMIFIELKGLNSELNAFNL